MSNVFRFSLPAESCARAHAHDLNVSRLRSVLIATAAVLALLSAPPGVQAAHASSPAGLAGPFSNIYFFGDSLTDGGNFVEQIEVDGIPGAVAGQEGVFYWENRFSNGPTWADQLAKALGHTATASLLGGTNYARAAAHNIRPNPNPAFNVVFGETGWLLSEQVGEHLAGPAPGDPDALYVIFMGSNDFPVGGALDPAPGVAEIVKAVEDLHAAGARRFLVWGLFPFVVPGFEPLEAYALSFNDLLPVALDGLEDSLEGVVITRASLVDALGPIFADPAAFGFTNPGTCTELGWPFPSVGAGDPACQAEALTDTFFGRPVGDSFISHDGIHFTTATYRFWSDYAVGELCRTRIQEDFPGQFSRRVAEYLCER